MALSLIVFSSAFGALLLSALLGFIHRKLDYRRADALTAAAFAGAAALFFFGDPLPNVIGKESLYLAFAAAAALLSFLGLKLDEHFKNAGPSLLAIPLLAAVLAAILHVSVHLTDDSDYRPRAKALRRTR